MFDAATQCAMAASTADVTSEMPGLLAVAVYPAVAGASEVQYFVYLLAHLPKKAGFLTKVACKPLCSYMLTPPSVFLPHTLL